MTIVTDKKTRQESLASIWDGVWAAYVSALRSGSATRIAAAKADIQAFDQLERDPDMTNIDQAVAQIKAAREQSELCWEMAKDTAANETAAAEWQSEGEACDDHYSDALDDIENGDYAGALESLELARALEQAGGDDQHGRRAIAALQSVLSDSTAT